MAGPDHRLAEWSARFEKTTLARNVVTSLSGRAQEIWRRTFDLLRSESPEYRNAVDDEFTAESKSHCGELLGAIVAVASGRLPQRDPFAFVRRHAEWRARHQVPLVASLHAYRLAHKTYWGLTRESLNAHHKPKDALRALALLSDFWIELFEAAGATLEEAHAAEEARIFAQNTQAHADLVRDLLNGRDPRRTESRQLLTLCGIRQGMNVTVAVIRRFPAADGKQVDANVAQRSLVRLLHQVLPSSIFGKVIGLQDGEVLAIAGSEADTSALLAKHLTRHGFGRKGQVGAGAGIGLDKPETGQLPDALAEARIALDLACPTHATMRFADIDLADFLIRRADRTALRLIPDWLREAHANGHDTVLIRTIRQFAECSLNVKQTARMLGVHTNTVYFRLNHIKTRTGTDPRTFAGTNLLLTSLRLLDTFGTSTLAR